MTATPKSTTVTLFQNVGEADGAGMYNHTNSSPMVTNCIFMENSVLGGIGGEDGGGMVNANNSNPRLTNCTFIANTAGLDGGAMLNANSNPILVNCTFSGNSANNDGGGIYNEFESMPTVTNCIFWENIPNEIVDNSGSSTLVNYSDVQGGWSGSGGIGNIDADPLFANAAAVDFHLLPGSPCIDAGDNTAVPLSITTDLDGNPRFLDDPATPDTGNGTPPIVDMGAYEFGEDCPDDLLECLVEDIIDLDLPQGQENALTATLNAASTLIENGNDNAAVNLLNAFINQVEAFSGNFIPEEDANALIAAAEAIIALLEAG